MNKIQKYITDKAEPNKNDVHFMTVPTAFVRSKTPINKKMQYNHGKTQ